MQIYKLFKKEKGATLIETVVYIGLVSIVFTGMIWIAFQFVSIKQRASAISIISSETNSLFERIIRDVRDGSSFTVLDDTTLQVVKDGVTYEYTLQDWQVYVNDGENNHQVTTSQTKVTSLTFTDWTSVTSDSFLHITISIQRGDLSETFQTSVHKRH